MELRLTLDARRRINLGKLLPDPDVHSVRAYIEGDKIILEPLVEISARELRQYKNQDPLDSVQKGLEQSREGKLRRRN